MISIFIILILILFNGLFSMAEIAIITSRKSRLQQMFANGNKGAGIALKLAQIPNKFFSTIQIGITLIAILTGAIGEATLVTRFSEYFKSFPIIGIYNESLAFILIIGAITYLSILIGELVPKRLAISNPEGIASFVAPFMNSFLEISMPIVKALSSSSEAITRLLGVKSIPSQTISDEEIKLLMGEGARVGIFTLVEKRLVNRVLHLDDTRIDSLMIPRANIQYFDINKLHKDLPKHLENYQHSRLVICDKSLNNLIGVIYVKDFLQFHLDKPQSDIKKYLKKPHLIQEDTPVIQVLEQFRKSPMHLAFVVDLQGFIKGLVTLNDVLEEIVGDIENINQIVTRQ